MSAPRVTTAPRVVAVTASSPAHLSGLSAGDELLFLNGRVPRDVIEYSMVVDEPDLELVVRRRGRGRPLHRPRGQGAGRAPRAWRSSSAVFDRVRTCDNHCEFCFIHQLPKGMRRSLSLKDDDYRLSFLYGNFTTLTRFTEMDLERVLTERLSPLFVSIHSTDPEIRADLLRNRRGATSLRWLGALLDGGIEVHGQVVVCPGNNDGAVLARHPRRGARPLPAPWPRWPVCPSGSAGSPTRAPCGPTPEEEAAAVCDAVEEWQQTFLSAIGRRMVFAADEYYLMADRPFPAAATYEGFPQHENGLGMARAFEAAFGGDERAALGVRPGFFAAVDGAPAAGLSGPTGGPGAGPPAGTRRRSPSSPASTGRGSWPR